jgi:hypothetical protein
VNASDTAAKKQDDFFQNEFANEKRDSSVTVNPVNGEQITTATYKEEPVLKSAKLFRYKPLKFSADFGGVSLTNNILINRYQVYQGGSGPIQLNSSSALNGLFKLGVSDLMEDIKINGAFKIGTNFKDNEWLINYQNLKRRFDWGLTYYRNVESSGVNLTDGGGNTVASYPAKLYTNLYQANVSYPFDAAKSIRFTGGLRSENIQVSIVDNISPFINIQRRLYSTSHLEYVYDNSLYAATNIWNGLRYKIYADWNVQVGKKETLAGRNTYNVGFDARYYYPIYRNFIWAGRAAGDFSFGNQKINYYLGGVDGWLMFGNNIKSDGSYRYFNEANKPAQDQDYAFQSLAVNMRGYLQNLASGNNAVVINSEFRLPIWSTFFDKTVNNAFVRDFQIIQFIDLGTAWNGGYEGIKRPSNTYIDNTNGNPGPVAVKIKAGGVGPFAGGYGFGARSTLLGYFVKFDAGWPMDGFFKGKPVYYFALGIDF